jgi:hypothetical protein
MHDLPDLQCPSSQYSRPFILRQVGGSYSVGVRLSYRLPSSRYSYVGTTVDVNFSSLSPLALTLCLFWVFGEEIIRFVL